MIKEDIKLKNTEEWENEPPVYNRISDAVESSHKAFMKDTQKRIMLDNTQQNHSSINNHKGSYRSRRKVFRWYHSLSFINNSYTTGGYISCCLSGLSFGFMLYCLTVSVDLRGQIGTSVGFFALFSFVFALFGFIIGLHSFKEEEKSYLFSRIGSYFSLLLMLFWIVMYIRGLFIR